MVYLELKPPIFNIGGLLIFFVSILNFSIDRGPKQVTAYLP